MGQKISQLTALSTTYADTDLLEVSVDTGGGTFVTRKMTFLQLRTAFTKLQANIDVNSFQITSASNGNIIIRPNGSGAVLVGGNSSQATELRFMEDSDNGTNYVALKVADALAASTTYTLPTADGTTGQVLSTNGTGTLSWATAAGGLTNFTEAANSSAPNGTVPVNSLTATGAATNIDAAIVPKGTGAFMLDIPDNTATGGNKRGINAVDLQTDRSAASQVASGNYGFIGGGRCNTASGHCSAIIGGRGNTASAYGSIVLGGQSNTSSSSRASVLGGANNTASGGYSAILGVRSNTASGFDSTVSGSYSTGSASSASVIGGQSNTASGDFSISGGRGNIASGCTSGTVSGRLNTASALYGFIGGGCGNTVNASDGAILGGRGNTTNSNACAFIVGSNITADRACATFVNNLSIKNIPTSSAGLPSGSVWSDSGTLKIV